MKHFVLSALLVTGLAACTNVNSQNQDEVAAGAAIGGIAGAVIGNDQNRERNAVAGALIGAAAGAAAGNANTCTYRNTRTGETFKAECGTY